MPKTGDMSVDGSNTRGVIMAVISALGWSVTGIFVKLLPDFSAWFLVASRSLVAFSVTLIFMSFFSDIKIKEFISVGANWWLSFLMMAYYATAVSAYQFSGVAEVALLLNTSPVFALIIRVYRGGKVSVGEWVAATIAIAGLTIILLPDILSNSNYSHQRLIGAVLALLSSYVITVYATQLESFKHKGVKLSISNITLLTYLMGAVVLGLVSLMVDSSPIVQNHFSSYVALLIVGFGIISTVIPSVAYGVALQHISAVQLTTLRLLIPISATFFAFWILHEIPNIWMIPGSILVIVGIVLLLKQNR